MFSENCNSIPTPPFHLNNFYNLALHHSKDNWSTPKAPFIIIPRHPVSPGLTNHNHSQRGIASRDQILPSDWSDAFRCRGHRALSYKILPRLATNVSPGCRVDIYKLEPQTKDPEVLQSRRRSLLTTSAFSLLKAPTSAFTFKTLC